MAPQKTRRFYDFARPSAAGSDEAATPSSPVTAKKLRLNEDQSVATSQRIELTLDKLPADILIRLAELLEIDLEQEGGNSSNWCNPGSALLNYTATCRNIYAAARHRVGRRYGIKSYPTWKELNRLLSPLTGDSPPTDAVAASLRLRPLPFIDASVIRHFYLCSTINEPDRTSLYPSDELLARAIKGMPRLTTFAASYQSEEITTLVSPYAHKYLRRRVIRALAESPTLEAIYLSGISVCVREPLVDVNESVTFAAPPVFGQAMAKLTMNVIHDSCFEMIPLMPGLKRLKVWRDFSSTWEYDPTEWFNESMFGVVEELEVIGVSGREGKALIDHWLSTLTVLPVTSPSLSVVLTNLCLTEAYSARYLVDSILPAVQHLPRLVKFSIIIWKDRRFAPKLLTRMSESMKGLQELTIGLENEELNWWPGLLTDYATAIALFPLLRILTWNHTPCVAVDYHFLDAQHTLFPALVSSFGVACKKLERLAWIGEEDYLMRDEETGNWRWRYLGKDEVIGDVSGVSQAEGEEDQEGGEKERKKARGTVGLMERMGGAALTPKTISDVGGNGALQADATWAVPF